MRIKFTLDPDDSKVFGKMAKEANLEVADLARIAVFNLIAIWVKDKGRVSDESTAEVEVKRI